MQSKKNFFSTFVIFIFLSAIAIFLSNHHILPGENFIEDILFPLESIIFKVARAPSGVLVNPTIVKIQQENQQLHEQLASLQKVMQDDVALRDQFETTEIPTQQLLPAEIIADPQFIPGVSAPENIVIDKGSANGISVGDTVVYKTNVVGTIVHVSSYAALVDLVSNKASSFTVKTSATNAQGVLVGQGAGIMILGNVLLSDGLRVGDTVVTNGSQDIAGHGFPPGLIVGKITSVNKNPSSLYQSASVESLLHVQKLSTVFVMTEK